MRLVNALLAGNIEITAIIIYLFPSSRMFIYVAENTEAIYIYLLCTVPASSRTNSFRLQIDI